MNQKQFYKQVMALTESYPVIERAEFKGTKLRLFITDKTILDVHVNKSVSKYSFMMMAPEKTTRWNNSPHHKNIPTFPDHLHINGTLHPSPLRGSILDKLMQVLDFISQY